MKLSSNINVNRNKISTYKEGNVLFNDAFNTISIYKETNILNIYVKNQPIKVIKHKLLLMFILVKKNYFLLCHSMFCMYVLILIWFHRPHAY